MVNGYFIIKNMSLSYYNTIHSSQGSKISEQYVIADYDHPIIDNIWFNVAITRGKNFIMYSFIKIITAIAKNELFTK